MQLAALATRRRAVHVGRIARSKTRQTNREGTAMTKLTRRIAIAGGLSTLMAAPARSNPEWPDRPITMVHGFPPGGPTDLVARIVADGLSRRLNQRVVVEGRPGASGTTADR